MCRCRPFDCGGVLRYMYLYRSPWQFPCTARLVIYMPPIYIHDSRPYWSCAISHNLSTEILTVDIRGKTKPCLSQGGDICWRLKAGGLRQAERPGGDDEHAVVSKAGTIVVRRSDMKETTRATWSCKLFTDFLFRAGFQRNLQKAQSILFQLLYLEILQQA